MYVSRNDFGLGGNLMVRYSTDNGLTWTNERQLAPANPFIRDVQITGDATNGNVYVAGMNEGGGGLANRMNLLYKSTDGGNTFTKTFTSTAFSAPGSTLCASNTYFACMFSGPAYCRHMGWGQPGVFNNVVHYVYDSRNTSNGDTGNIFYIRSTDGGVTFSTPLQLNTDTTTRPQWQPNLSVGSDGSVLAVWYDARESTTCTKGNSSVPCYRMWARKSTDNGATWAADAAFSDVVSPLPAQSDPNIVTEYVGDYDYSFAGAAHIHPWTDGRVAINSASQQDAFVDQEAIGGGGNELTLKGRGQTQGNKRRAKLQWKPTDNTGSINIIRDGVVVQTVPDTGTANDNLPAAGTYMYQVCETDSGDCSNTISVTVQ
jgi:Neuraminidase (sialidase)